MNELKYEEIIGLEIHVELKTKSKMFCGCSANYFGHEPNTYTCPVCLGLPGALPVPNKKAIEWCVMLGMALGCDIPLMSKFDRKNYFYPDLPKGYQISQYDEPFAKNGQLVIPSRPLAERNPVGKTINGRDPSPFGTQDDGFHTIRIRRVHMEEDTGKLMHAMVDGKPSTLIDFNRSGVPLVEIVTEPDIRSSEEARIFLKKLHQIIRYLGVSDADMEKGSMRIEPNISVRKMESGKWKMGELPKYKVEVKNINSFGFAKKAIDYEIERHIEILERGEIPMQETRGYNEDKGITVTQRSKEEAHDYRYFPEPDIPPIRWDSAFLETIRAQIPELPDDKLKRFEKDFGLSHYDAIIVIDSPERVAYFEETVRVGKEHGINPKTIANWLVNKKINIDETLPAKLIEQIVTSTKKEEIPEEELKKVIEDVIAQNSKAVEDYKNGKEQSLMFLVGQVMRTIKKKIDAKKIIQIIKFEVNNI